MVSLLPDRGDGLARRGPIMDETGHRRKRNVTVFRGLSRAKEPPAMILQVPAGA
jgi:hypothetical protein